MKGTCKKCGFTGEMHQVMIGEGRRFYGSPGNPTVPFGMTWDAIIQCPECCFIQMVRPVEKFYDPVTYMEVDPGNLGKPDLHSVCCNIDFNSEVYGTVCPKCHSLAVVQYSEGKHD